MVTYNSIAPLEAMVYGKPSDSVRSQLCLQDVCEKSLGRVEFPEHPDVNINVSSVHPFNNPFTYEEMLSGYAWSVLK